MNNAIIDAITNKKVLTFSYDGHPRVVEPHAYGVTTAGHDAIRAYQTGGSSSSGDVPTWRLFLVSEIRGLSENGDEFANARPGYKRGDKGMTRIYCQL